MNLQVYNRLVNLQQKHKCSYNQIVNHILKDRVRDCMKPFKSYNEEKFKIPHKEIDNYLYKTIEIVKYEVKKDVEIGKECKQGNLTFEILHLLKKEWEKKEWNQLLYSVLQIRFLRSQLRRTFIVMLS